MTAALPTLRNRFALAFALPFFLMAAVLAVLSGNAAMRELKERAGLALGDAAFQIADKLDRDLWNRQNTVELLATLDVLREPRDPAALRRLVDDLKNSFDITAWVGFTGRNGIVVAASDRILEGVDISARPVFQNGIRGNFVGDVHDAVLLARLLPNPTGEAMKFVDLASPVYGGDGRVIGTLGVHLSWSWAARIRTSVLTPQLAGRDVEGLVISADGTVLLGPGELLGRRLDLAAIAAARSGTTGFAEETWPDGRVYLTGYARSVGYLSYPGLGWVTLVRQPVDHAYAAATEMRDHVLLWAAAFSIGFAVFGWFAAGWITGPLTRIAATADHIRAGESAATIPVDARIREIRQLATSLRDLVESLGHKQRALDTMEDKAHRDTLTGLANRAEFERRVAALTEARDPVQSFACLYLDLDGFKPINDSHGHAIGDRVLQQVAARLRDALRGDDLVARVGGDEFVLVLHGPAEGLRRRAAAVAGRVLIALGAPMTFGDLVVAVGCSIGYAVWREDADTVEALLAKADAALYAAKRGGRNRAVGAGGADDPAVAALS